MITDTMITAAFDRWYVRAWLRDVTSGGWLYGIGATIDSVRSIYSFRRR